MIRGIFFKANSIITRVRLFFKCKAGPSLYLSGVGKNMTMEEGIDVEEGVRETKAWADVKSRSNTLHLNGMKSI